MQYYEACVIKMENTTFMFGSHFLCVCVCVFRDNENNGYDFFKDNDLSCLSLTKLIQKLFFSEL